MFKVYLTVGRRDTNPTVQFRVPSECLQMPSSCCLYVRQDINSAAPIRITYEPFCTFYYRLWYCRINLQRTVFN